jgi:hypothetical protein
MEITKRVTCPCGKNKKIIWQGVAEFKSGLSTFCAGISQCKKCNEVEYHYSGDVDDILAFHSQLESDHIASKMH